VIAMFSEYANSKNNNIIPSQTRAISEPIQLQSLYASSNNTFIGSCSKQKKTKYFMMKISKTLYRYEASWVWSHPHLRAKKLKPAVYGCASIIIFPGWQGPPDPMMRACFKN
jgi:hypothetical protein